VLAIAAGKHSLVNRYCRPRTTGEVASHTRAAVTGFVVVGGGHIRALAEIGDEVYTRSVL